MTNGDKIRKSNDEELASLFTSYEFSFMIDICSGNYKDDKEFMLEWIRQEVGDGE